VGIPSEDKRKRSRKKEKEKKEVFLLFSSPHLKEKGG
jgi:hypothetical protein